MAAILAPRLIHVRCSNGTMLYIETSAKTGSNVAALFELIAEHVAAPPPT